MRPPIRELDAERIARLPVYAQDHVKLLQMRVRELTAELDALVSPDHAVTTHADPSADRPKPIGDNPTIRHRMSGGREVRLELDSNRIAVSTRGGVERPLVAPWVSNVLHIYVVDVDKLDQDPRRD